MATHRPHDTGFAPDVAFQLALGVLEASEDLAARRRPITPTLSPASFAPAVQYASHRTANPGRLAQVQRWRDQILTRDLLQHRRQLCRAVRSHRGGTAALERGLVYLTRMRRETDALLHHSLTTAGGPEPAAARPSTGGPPARYNSKRSAAIARHEPHAPRPKSPFADDSPGGLGRTWGPSTANCRLVD